MKTRYRVFIYEDADCPECFCGEVDSLEEAQALAEVTEGGLPAYLIYGGTEGAVISWHGINGTVGVVPVTYE